MGKNRLVMYFGTTHKGSGHNLSMLNGRLSSSEQIRIGGEIDSDENLYSCILNTKGISYAYYRGITLLCIPYSLHDDRGGCKTIFMVEGKLSKLEILDELKKYESVYKEFNLLADKYGLKYTNEIKFE